MAARLGRCYGLVAAVYCLLSMGTGALAKTDRTPTSAPTTAKNFKPPKPTVVLLPDTAQPTYEANSKPTVIVVDTSEPTQTTKPTSTPGAPTQTPSLAPTSPLTGVALASMTLNITTDGQEVVDTEVLGMDMEVVLNIEVLAKVYESFSHVDLNVSIAGKERRSLQTGERVDMEGVAYFRGEPIPTTFEMTDFLTTYFSIVGSGDLTNRLSTGNPQIKNVELFIDGQMVGVADQSTGTTPKEVVTPNTPNDSSVSAGLIGGLLAGCAALCIAVGLLVWQQRKGRNKAPRKPAVPSPAKTTAISSPRDTGSDRMSMEELSVGVISVEDSIYTTNSDLLFTSRNSRERSISPERYDAKRLDKVIQNAQNFSSTTEPTESDETLNDDMTFWVEQAPEHVYAPAADWATETPAADDIPVSVESARPASKQPRRWANKESERFVGT